MPHQQHSPMQHLHNCKNDSVIAVSRGTIAYLVGLFADLVCFLRVCANSTTVWLPFNTEPHIPEYLQFAITFNKRSTV